MQVYINTTINGNSKIKIFENKFNLTANNYANSSHIKEIIDQNK